MFLDLRWLESGTTVLTLNTPVVFSAHICTQAASSQCCTVRQSQTLSDREGVLWFSIRIPSEISRREQITHRTYNRITDTRFGKSKSMPCSFVKQIVLLSTSTVFLDYGYKIWFITLCSSFTALTPARRAQENLGHGGITVAGCGCQWKGEWLVTRALFDPRFMLCFCFCDFVVMTVDPQRDTQSHTSYTCKVAKCSKSEPNAERERNFDMVIW